MPYNMHEQARYRHQIFIKQISQKIPLSPHKISMIKITLSILEEHFSTTLMPSGELVIKFVMNSALITADIKADSDLCIASLISIHEFFKKKSFYIQINHSCSENILALVQEVIEREGYKNHISLHKSISHPILANIPNSSLTSSFTSIQDIRIVIILIAYRVEELRFLKQHISLNQKVSEKIIQETLLVYLPLISRLGLYCIKKEIEDLSFYLFHRNYYLSIQKEHSFQRTSIVSLINALKNTISNDGKIPFIIQSRIKQTYSIYHKMKAKNLSSREIYDFSGIRVIVNNLYDCYNILHLVHQLWQPIKNQFLDYIQNPKKNFYQSIHTTVLTPKYPLEIQIRTQEMHENAENGLSAHWLYKEKERYHYDLWCDEKIQSLKKKFLNEKEEKNKSLVIF